MSWQPVISYLKNTLKQDDKKEKFLFDTYDPAALEKIVSTQFKLIQHMKKNNMKKLFQICIILDDMGENRQFMRGEKLLETLYVRGRHFACSTFTSVQTYKMLNPILRKNCTQMYIFRLRNHADLEGIIEEVSAIYEKPVLYEIYKLATQDSRSFLYVDLMQTKAKKMLFFKFKLEKQNLPKWPKDNPYIYLNAQKCQIIPKA